MRRPGARRDSHGVQRGVPSRVFFLRSESNGVGWGSRMSDQVDDHGGPSESRDVRMEADARDEALSFLDYTPFPSLHFLVLLDVCTCPPARLVRYAKL
jgi:hypothetical protein